MHKKRLRLLGPTTPKSIDPKLLRAIRPELTTATPSLATGSP